MQVYAIGPTRFYILGDAVILLADLEDFVHDHCSHGPMTSDATEPAWNGYLLLGGHPKPAIGSRRSRR